MKLPAHVRDLVESHPDWLPFTLTNSWVCLPDDNGENHCSCCGSYVHPGDPCLVRYFVYTSIVFCLTCLRDNEALMRGWM
jgi:hypothetical protein